MSFAKSVLKDHSYKHTLNDTSFGQAVNSIANKVFGAFDNVASDVSDFFDNVTNTFQGALDDVNERGISGIWDDYTGNSSNQANIEYQKEYNQEVWNRADTQYQRTVADLRAAGLSSQLAAGAPSTVAGHGAAPQRTVGNESQAIERLIGMITSLKQTDASVNLTNAQADKARAETAMVNKEIGTYAERTAVDIALKRAQTGKETYQAQLYMTQGQYEADRIMSEINRNKAFSFYYNKKGEIESYSAETQRMLAESSIDRNGYLNKETLANIDLLSARAAEATANKLRLDKEAELLTEKIYKEHFEGLAAEWNMIIYSSTGRAVGEAYPDLTKNPLGIIGQLAGFAGSIGFNFMKMHGLNKYGNQIFGLKDTRLPDGTGFGFGGGGGSAW